MPTPAPIWPSLTTAAVAVSSARATSAGVRHRPVAHVAPGRRIALADHGDDDVVAADAGLTRREHARRAGVDVADVRRAREEDGRLLVAPLVDRLRARELAGPVERRGGTEVGGMPGVARMRPDGRDAGVVGRCVGVADAHAGNVGDRVRGAGRELPHDEPEIACAHRAKLALHAEMRDVIASAGAGRRRAGPAPPRSGGLYPSSEAKSAS